MQHHEGLVEEKTDVFTPPFCLLGDIIEVCLRLLVSNKWETFSLSCLCAWCWLSWMLKGKRTNSATFWACLPPWRRRAELGSLRMNEEFKEEIKAMDPHFSFTQEHKPDWMCVRLISN